MLPRHSRRQFERFAVWLFEEGSRRWQLDAVRLAQQTYRDATRLEDWSPLISGSPAGSKLVARGGDPVG